MRKQYGFFISKDNGAHQAFSKSLRRAKQYCDKCYMIDNNTNYSRLTWMDNMDYVAGICEKYWSNYRITMTQIPFIKNSKKIFNREKYYFLIQIEQKKIAVAEDIDSATEFLIEWMNNSRGIYLDFSEIIFVEAEGGLEARVMQDPFSDPKVENLAFLKRIQVV